MAEPRRQSYVYGNTVRQPEPVRRERRQKPSREPRRASAQVRRNRRRTQGMTVGYVSFLTLAAMIAVLSCVGYLQLQSRVSERSSNITSLQKQLTSLKMENDAALSAVNETVNLEEIRVQAANMGMTHATSDQVIEYVSPSGDYLKQYEDIPKSGVLAQSDKSSE